MCQAAGGKGSAEEEEGEEDDGDGELRMYVFVVIVLGCLVITVVGELQQSGKWLWDARPML